MRLLGPALIWQRLQPMRRLGLVWFLLVLVVGMALP